MKNKIHTFGTFPKSYQNIVEVDKLDTCLVHLLKYESGVVKLVCCTQTFSLIEMIQIIKKVEEWWQWMPHGLGIISSVHA